MAQTLSERYSTVCGYIANAAEELAREARQAAATGPRANFTDYLEVHFDGIRREMNARGLILENMRRMRSAEATMEEATRFDNTASLQRATGAERA